MDGKHSVMGGLVRAFLTGNFAVLLILVSLLAGAIALMVTPREEEPQIVVPLADVLVMYPGGSAAEVEKMVSSRLERLLYQIDGVEYVYSTSRPGMAVVTVRFYVGEDREASLIKLYNKIFQNVDKATPGIAGWVVKPVEVDDVPILTATLHSRSCDTHALYRIAEEVVGKLQHVPDSAAITIHGGEKRQLTVYLDPEQLAAHGLCPREIAGALQAGNLQLQAGSFEQGNAVATVAAGPFLRDAGEVANLMVGLHAGRPVYLRDVARIADGPAEPRTLTRFHHGPADPAFAAPDGAAPRAAVSIAVAKKKGSNAVQVARELERALRALQGRTIPDNVAVRITRDYGATANEKVNDLVLNLGLGMLTVVALIALTMSWRVGVIVGLAIPITYALTLLCNFLFGYTINRVTLFALILALGLLVDNPIVSVENIYRFFAMKRHRREEAVQLAMEEVMPPIVLATLAIIVSFIPMFFISGMMGPYMRPMALNVPLTMISSMLVAFALAPWLANKLLRAPADNAKPYDVRTTRTYAVYSRLAAPFVDSRRAAWLLLAVMAALFAGALLLAATGRVPLKMLPFDNKNEFQLVLDLPESAPLEMTDALARDAEDYLRGVPEVVDFTTTLGAPSPMDFNGLVRHYYLRQAPNLGDIRVNLLPRQRRAQSSHDIILRIRNDIAAIAERHGAQVKLVEAPPGPPVLATVVAEIYGQPHQQYDELIAGARQVAARLRQEPGVVEVDDSVETNQQKWFFHVDRDLAGRSGIAAADAAQVLRLALDGQMVGTVHTPSEQNELPLVLRLPRDKRSDTALLATLPIKGRQGQFVQLGELGRFEEQVEDKSIMHKNQERVVYVTAEMAGRGPAEAVLAMQQWLKANPLPAGLRADWAGEGEWKITVDVFRDLGIAFAVALLAIYVLLVYETSSYLLPLVIMMSIPLTLIGIMPGFWLLNLLVNRPVGGFDTPVFFTATAMIGMIALGGIVQRNAIILIDFIRVNTAAGRSLREAILESGATRFRPIFLTAGTTLLGAWPITLDPIFSGLAWSIIFGLFVSTIFTLLVIPVVYNLIYGRGTGKVGD